MYKVYTKLVLTVLLTILSILTIIITEKRFYLLHDNGFEYINHHHFLNLTAKVVIC
ncbi:MULTISPECIES: hypothetical protein [unclassified Clostridioides]|uniref:hypothetical protein n=1 Tax=unclassified Clostridioides TaxID=2635829 RepID=UPI001D115C58|nr:hypothetical protein [Clostridioides sp. ES-S-0171-01]UDN54107.1 hypothetical protein JJC02_14570 [Clostridioides sp. ES-S-0054-01]